MEKVTQMNITLERLLEQSQLQTVHAWSHPMNITLELLQQIRAAFNVAVETIRSWHDGAKPDPRAWEIYMTRAPEMGMIRETQEVLRMLVEAPERAEPHPPLFHQSGVNPRGEPFVQLLLGNQIIGQMDPEQARDHARAITEAAEAAELDVFLLDWAQNRIGVPRDAAGAMVNEFREYRQKITGKSQGPRNPSDWVMPAPENMANYGGHE